jgi:hypothetical protein
MPVSPLVLAHTSLSSKSERPGGRYGYGPAEDDGQYDRGVGKGYAEGPATEERLAALEQPDARPPAPHRLAIYGSTEAEPRRHFIGWRDEVDPDELFASGRAWGLSVVKRTP